jgi:protoporphyrinogen oxidase
MIMKNVVIIGAGPAGLTAAYELAARSAIKPIVFESTSVIGGLARTVEHNGNRMDIGGHRFFSKSPELLDWWFDFLPLEADAAARDASLAKFARPQAPNPVSDDKVMLLRDRKSRIYFEGRFYDYPLKPGSRLLRSLGFRRSLRILKTYLEARRAPIVPVASLEDFFLNRFGRELYHIFFKSYTEKVWGVPCNTILADWGEERIQKLSLGKVIVHALRGGTSNWRVKEKSLIEFFLYPKYGPGQLWDEVAKEIVRLGGEIRLNHKVVGVSGDAVTVEDAEGRRQRINADSILSSMPLDELVLAFDPPAPEPIRALAAQLHYRDFMTLGLLVRRLQRPLTDNWLYIHEQDIGIGRVQIFNNWSPWLLKEKDKVWIGLEYFCNAGDALSSLSDADFTTRAIAELTRIGLIDPADILDHLLLRVPKAYPGYSAGYTRLPEIRAWLDLYPRLLPIGRNGRHRYSNMDEAMLSGIRAAEHILNPESSRDKIWEARL